MKKKEQYRRILVKAPRLYEASLKLYTDYEEDGKDGGSGEDAWISVFCHVFAPALFSYVRWVLFKAQESGKSRLYFLARDGYMMYLVAKKLCEMNGLRIECRYLYCSRYALRSAEYMLLGEECLAYICLGGMNVTFEKLMRRSGLSEAEAEEVARRLGYAEHRRERLSYGQIKAFHSRLRESPFYMEKVLAHAKERYPLAISYLKQEGLADNVPYAIVDSGWTGSMQRSLYRLLKSAGYKGTIEGYYFGMYEYTQDMERSLYHTYYFSPEKDNFRKAFFCNNLFECVFSSPEGMTTGYLRTEAGYKPIFAASGNPNDSRIRKGAGMMLRFTELYAEGEAVDEGSGKKAADMEKRAAARLFKAFMGRPSPEEAEAFGGYLFDDDVTGEEKRPVAAALSSKQLKESRLFHRLLSYAIKNEHPPVLSAWQEGSAVLLKGADTYELWHIAAYKYAMYMKKSLIQAQRSKEITVGKGK